MASPTQQTHNAAALFESGRGPSLSDLPTDICLNIVAQGLGLRDVAASTFVSKAWRRKWDAAMRESPAFFLHLFLPGQDELHGMDQHAESVEPDPSGTLRVGRYEHLVKSMRAELTRPLQSCDVSLISTALPDPMKFEPGEDQQFRRETMTPLPREHRERTQTRTGPPGFAYHRGIVAWQPSRGRVVMDNLHERTWRVIELEPFHQNRADPPAVGIRALTERILVCYCRPHKVAVCDLQSGSWTEPHDLGSDLPLLARGRVGASCCAVGWDVVARFREGHVARYRLSFPEPSQPLLSKINDFALPHNNFHSIFFEGEENSDTMFLVSHGKEKVVLLEYRHCALHAEHRAPFTPTVPLVDPYMHFERRCEKVDAAGTMELCVTNSTDTRHKLVQSSLLFSVPGRCFYWRHYRRGSPFSKRWNGWSYMISGTPSGHHTDVRALRGDECTGPAEVDVGPSSLDDQRQVEYSLEDEGFASRLPRLSHSQIQVDDDFLVFETDRCIGPYGVVDPMRKRLQREGRESILQRALPQRSTVRCGGGYRGVDATSRVLRNP